MSAKMTTEIPFKVGEGRVAKVADFGLTRDVYIDEAYWKRSSGKCKLLPVILKILLVSSSDASHLPLSPSANKVDGPRVNEGLPLHIQV